MKKVFTIRFQMADGLHPDIGVKLAQYLSVKNKLISGDEDVTFLGEEKKRITFKRKLSQANYLIFWSVITLKVLLAKMPSIST
jgi:UDP-2,3-diacylglucosamine hydrolase